MKHLPLLTALLASMGVAATLFAQQIPNSAPPPYHGPRSPSRVEYFDDSWRFHLGDAPGAEKPGFKDADWRTLDLPHDYAIEGEFDIHSPAGAGGGYLTAGTAWYRKTFSLPAGQQGKCITILFDGVYMDSDVYLNGVLLGNHPYGYTSFYYDLTPHLIPGGNNVLAVRVHVEQPSSRWYSGAGIYRHVHLITTDPVHVAPWDFQVASVISNDSARVSLTTAITGAMKPAPTMDEKGSPMFVPYRAPAKLRVVYTITDPDGKTVGTTNALQRGSMGGDGNGGNAAGKSEREPLDGVINVPHPRLWSPETPVLYHAKSEVFLNDKLVDTTETTFGIRAIEFTTDKGFLLNGKPYPIHGVCDHHDLGCLGSATYRDAIERQLTLLKSIGCNAIRTSHNPPSPELLDLCDSMGFLVMDEAFDEWKLPKTKFGYSRFFDAWSERDILSMVHRDRNHPSIILWSIGNEIEEQASPDGGTMAKRLASIVRSADPTRAVTAGCNMADHAIETRFADALDVLGLNYHIDWYQKFKGRTLTGSETASAISSRGEYNLLPGADGKLEIKPEYSHQVTSYDTKAPGWATLVEPSLQSLKDAPWVAGQFVWTGFDYIGEPTPYGWPSRSSYFGIFDLAGFRKDRAWLYESQWTDKPVVHLFPHWNWAGSEGKEIPVRCYTNADSVELFLNDKSLGIRAGKDTKALHLEWLVPYAPGTLKAVATRDGQVIATDEVKTAGIPAKIIIDAEPATLFGSHQLAFIPVTIVDAEGVVCPDAVNKLQFTITSRGDTPSNPESPATARIIATDNGDATDHNPLPSPDRKAFHGRALAVLRATGSNAHSTLTITSTGLQPATLEIGWGQP